MGRKRNEDSSSTDESLEYQSFQEYLYKNRLSWTRHVVPISYRDPHLGLYMEGYITAAVSNDNEESSEEESEEISLKSPVLVRAAVLSHLYNPLLEIRIEEIYPSNRRLLKIEDRTKMGDVKQIPLYQDAKIDQFRPKDKVTIDTLKFLDKFYKGTSWTIEELAKMINTSSDDPLLLEKVKTYNKSIKRICKITGELADTFIPVYQDFDPSKLKSQHMVVNTIEQLRKDYKNCIACDLGKSTQERKCAPVFGRGNTKNPKYFLIGEAPGTEEEATGIPFNPDAPAGGLLARTLAKAGITELDYYITNSVLCRPLPEEGSKSLNGKPTMTYIKHCNSRLKNELILLKPKSVILIGKFAYMSYFGKEPESVLKSAGIQSTTSGPIVLFVPHPSYILRTINMSKPEEREMIKDDYADYFIKLKDQINAV